MKHIKNFITLLIILVIGFIIFMALAGNNTADHCQTLGYDFGRISLFSFDQTCYNRIEISLEDAKELAAGIIR